MSTLGFDYSAIQGKEVLITGGLGFIGSNIAQRCVELGGNVTIIDACLEPYGWNHANILWEIRGLIDRFLGGVGLHRGRRDPHDLRVGDSVDFWRVEKLEPNRELLLRAEMITPGLSWLQFQLGQGKNGGTRLTLRAHFIPKPFWGNLYWVALSNFHSYIFKGMLEFFKEKSS